MDRGMDPVVMTIINPWERILAEPGIEPLTSCFQVRKATEWAMGLGIFMEENVDEQLLLWISIQAHYKLPNRSNSIRFKKRNVTFLKISILLMCWDKMTEINLE